MVAALALLFLLPPRRRVRWTTAQRCHYYFLSVFVSYDYLAQMNARRSSFATKRPLSAIFLGSTPTSSNHLPDLPEPPASPHSTSGLPSPPATNSTGSGSTGDNSTNAGSIRLPATTMLNGAAASSSGQRSESRASSIDADGNDEDSTARLSDDRKPALKRGPTADADLATLQRVQNLTQRNRMVR